MALVDPSEGGFDARLRALAELCVTRAVNLQQGQELIVSAPLAAAPLVRNIARFAYSRGCKAVTCLYEDPALIREHVAAADIDAVDYAPEWMYRGLAEGLRAGAARLQIAGPYPDLLAGISTERIMRAHGALARASRPVTELLASAAISRSIVPTVTSSWARQVFPHVPGDEAEQLLWQAVFDATRVVDDDPLQAWDAHVRTIDVRRDELQRYHFRSLRFFDGTTDLRVDLADGHQWAGGTVTAANGIQTVQSVPSEEVFTALRPDGAHGRVLFSKPLALGGTVVEQLYVEFDRGVLTTVKAHHGQDAFEQLLLAGDEDSRRLGEVGLVPASSRLARTGISFWNPLLDRNASSHVAFGQSPVACISGPRSQDAGAANQSAMHIDCALGDATMHVDGVTQSGSVIPIVRDGEFVD